MMCFLKLWVTILKKLNLFATVKAGGSVSNDAGCRLASLQNPISNGSKPTFRLLGIKGDL
jgi:hypothetical protein